MALVMSKGNAFVSLVGLVVNAATLSARTTATVMASASARRSVNATPDGEASSAPSLVVNAPGTENVSTLKHALALLGGPVNHAASESAQRSVLSLVASVLLLVIANATLDSVVSSAKSLLAKMTARATAFASSQASAIATAGTQGLLAVLLCVWTASTVDADLLGNASVMRDTRELPVTKRCALTIAVDMVNVVMLATAHACPVGLATIVQILCAPPTVIVTESAFHLVSANVKVVGVERTVASLFVTSTARTAGATATNHARALRVGLVLAVTPLFA
jgi:hypothetical protein